jgi:hypothetical protein
LFFKQISSDFWPFDSGWNGFPVDTDDHTPDDFLVSCGSGFGGHYSNSHFNTFS